MSRYKFFIFFIFISGFLFSQEAVTDSYGTIKIHKSKLDSIHIKVEMNFQRFQERNKTGTPPVPLQNKNITVPFPKGSGISSFDYNHYFNTQIDINSNDFAGKISDTIRIQIKVLDNGKAYYKDLTPLLVMNGVPAFYDKKMNAYQLDAIHWKYINALKRFKKWEPAYFDAGITEKFKRVTVIKPKRKTLEATGILTIIFSIVPFEE